MGRTDPWRCEEDASTDEGTGKKLDWTPSYVSRIANGTIVERWISADSLPALPALRPAL